MIVTYSGTAALVIAQLRNATTVTAIRSDFPDLRWPDAPDEGSAGVREPRNPITPGPPPIAVELNV